MVALDPLVDPILESAASLMKADYAFLYLYDPADDTLELIRSFGCSGEAIGTRVGRGVGLAGAVLQSGVPMVVNDYQSWQGRHPDPRLRRFKAVVVSPITGSGSLLGAIGAAHIQEGKGFSQADVARLGRLAPLAARLLLGEGERQALEQLRTSIEHREVVLRETYEATVAALATMIEMKDPYTAAHQRWVTQLACAIAAELGLSDEKKEGVRMACLIHDIGKMNVPSELLFKPRRLTEIEYEAIKVHPQSGYDIIKEISFPWPIAKIVLQHHERLDGSGYPQGISGGDILPEARLLAVADVVESMSSHRPYREAHGIEIALEEIEMKSGILYDPDVVKACLSLMRDKGFKFD